MTIPMLCISIVALIALSAFFSASEMTFSAANRLRLENAAERSVPGAKLALHITLRFEDALSAILVGNNLVNIATSSIGSVIAVTLWGEKWTGAMTAFLTITVIIFGETMPKIIAKKHANRLVLVLCYPIRILMILLRPVTLVIVGLVNLIMLLLPKPKTRLSEDEAQQELQSIIETAEDEHVLDEKQSDLLQAALEFDEISVSDIMTARVDIEAIDIEDDWEEILNTIEDAPYSRLPVYEDNLDHVLGVLYLNKLYRLLLIEDQADIRSLLNEPVYLYKTTPLPAALNTLRTARQQLAFIVDEYGGTMGLVTIEDIMEQLVGDIWDENDPVEQDDVIEHASGVYELDGDTPVWDFAELLDCKESELSLESTTVGGLITELNGTFPTEGLILQIKHAEIKVLEMAGLRVERILVTLQPDEPDDEDDE